ncbi:MAG: 6,7-dimethyl-8-ribityllumazine synthase [SAR324 cluster bacterium]|nr:6,7-dimethyl-8-ribityllumazine synthase [SAR324 cluster bacterium]
MSNKTSSTPSLTMSLEFKYLNVAIVRSSFNESITNRLLNGAKREFDIAKDYSMKHLEGAQSSFYVCDVFDVPGVFEVPYMVNQILNHGIAKYNGILTIGAVIKGETAHFEYISGATINALQILNISSPVPVSLGILTTQNEEQANERSKDDRSNKGAQAMLALLSIVASRSSHPGFNPQPPVRGSDDG